MKIKFYDFDKPKGENKILEKETQSPEKYLICDVYDLNGKLYKTINKVCSIRTDGYDSWSIYVRII